MTRLLLASVLTGFAFMPATVQAETWCLRSFGQERGVCAFPSARDCSQAATFNAFGGVCEREPLGDDTGKKRRSSNRPSASTTW